MLAADDFASAFASPQPITTEQAQPDIEASAASLAAHFNVDTVWNTHGFPAQAAEPQQQQALSSTWSDPFLSTASETGFEADQSFASSSSSFDATTTIEEPRTEADHFNIFDFVSLHAPSSAPAFDDDRQAVVDAPSALFDFAPEEAGDHQVPALCF